MIGIHLDTRPDPAFPLSRPELRTMLALVLEILDLEGGTLTLRLVDDAEIARLNAAYLGCTGPTNVLSFPSDEDDDLGAIALSVPTLARETRLYGQDPTEHLARLLVHAVLHLTGLEHGPEMETLTEECLQRLRTKA